MPFKTTEHIKNITEDILQYIKYKYNKNINKKQIIKIIKNNIKKSGICKFNSCETRSSFGKLGTTKPEYCLEHKPQDYVDVRTKKCIIINCGQNAKFRNINSKIEYCRKHKPIDSIDVRNKKKCIFEGCEISPTYGKPGIKKAEYCLEHKPEDYIDVKNKTCIFNGCETRATYGKPGTKNVEYCDKHKPTDYIDVLNKKCIYKGCGTRPNFGKLGGKPEYCAKHKPQDYIDVLDKKCIYGNCKTSATFGKQGSILEEYCAKHAPADYLNIFSKKCIFENCNIKPTFGKCGSKLAEYCEEHKPDDYVDVKNKKCIVEDCQTRPNFGKAGTKLAEYCDIHKPIDYIDVTHKKCIIDNCGSRANFGKLFCDKIHCGNHKQPNEYKKNNPKCINCKNKPIYTNVNNNYPLRCEDHKLKDDIDVISSICSSCKLTDYIKTGNLCNSCSIFEVIRKKQENIVKQLLDDNNIIYTTYDKIIKDGCSLKRPDFTFDLGDRIIVLEVDENQHSSYPVECETNRMIQIHQDYGGLDVCFIRYNPDTYKDKSGKIIKSNINKHKTLLNTLNSLMIHKPQYNLSAIYLYYDGYNNNNNKIVEIKTI